MTASTPFLPLIKQTPPRWLFSIALIIVSSASSNDPLPPSQTDGDDATVINHQNVSTAAGATSGDGAVSSRSARLLSPRQTMPICVARSSN